MAEVVNTQLVIAQVGRWNPRDLAMIERLEYKSKSDEKPSVVVMDALFQRRDSVPNGWPSDVGEFYKVRIQFESVTDLTIKNFGSDPKQVAGFDIVDVSQRGWENITFSIEDYERGEIEFSCDSIRILSVEKADNASD